MVKSLICWCFHYKYWKVLMAYSNFTHSWVCTKCNRHWSDC